MAKSTGLSFTKELLASLSLEFSDKEIGVQFGVSAANIKYWRHKLKIPTQYERHKLVFTKEEWIKLTDKYSDPELAKRFNVHKNAIREWRVKLGIPTKHRLKRRKTYQVNESFFSNIKTPEQAYVLGFISGDGNVHTKGRSFSISLSPKDREILVKIRNVMKGNMPIHTTSNERGFSSDPNAKLVVLDVCRKQIVRDLSKLGIKPAKTFNLKYPNIPKNLDNSFIRGVLDSDGWVGEKAFGFCGSGLFVPTIRNRIQKHTGILLSISISQIFSIQGFKSKKAVLEWLYKDATIYLERKYHNYIKYWS